MFFACRDVEATRAWYRDVLGFPLNDHGGADFSHGESALAHGGGARTIWAPFDKTDYFKPGTGEFMINLMVDDLDGMIARLAEHGVDMCQEPETHGYGKFAWVIDPDGRKLELWEPVKDVTVMDA